MGRINERAPICCFFMLDLSELLLHILWFLLKSSYLHFQTSRKQHRIAIEYSRWKPLMLINIAQISVAISSEYRCFNKLSVRFAFLRVFWWFWWTWKNAGYEFKMGMRGGHFWDYCLLYKVRVIVCWFQWYNCHSCIHISGTHSMRNPWNYSTQAHDKCFTILFLQQRATSPWR